MTYKTLKILRQRLGLEPHDSIHDAEIKAYTPEQIVQGLVAWEFGTPAWAGWFAKIVLENGADVKKLSEG